MNLVMSDAEEVYMKKDTRKKIGEIFKIIATILIVLQVKFY